MQSAKVLRWRFAFNLALMFFDGLVYFCIGLLVMYVSDGMQIVTTRLQLNMHINVYLYEAVCALIWHVHIRRGYTTGMYLLTGMH